MLSGLLVIIVGLAFRLNPLLIVTCAGLVTGLTGGIFIAIGSILLIKGVLEKAGIHVRPTQRAAWAVPTAIATFVVHGAQLPLLETTLHGNATIIAAIGTLSGFCGTLMTPMAANYNLVPVALLDLPDRWAVIRAQVPTALTLLAVNTALIWFLAIPR